MHERTFKYHITTFLIFHSPTLSKRRRKLDKTYPFEACDRKTIVIANFAKVRRTIHTPASPKGHGARSVNN